MKNEVAEYRNIAKTLRDAEDATDKVAGLEALKDLAWQLMKLSALQ